MQRSGQKAAKKKSGYCQVSVAFYLSAFGCRLQDTQQIGQLIDPPIQGLLARRQSGEPASTCGIDSGETIRGGFIARVLVWPLGFVHRPDVVS